MDTVLEPAGQVGHEEQMDELIEPYPGCPFASYCYERGLFDDHTLAVAEDGFEHWRELIGEEIRRALEAHPPRREVDLEELAYPRLVARQLGLFRQHVELLLDVTGEPAEGS